MSVKIDPESQTQKCAHLPSKHLGHRCHCVGGHLAVGGACLRRCFQEHGRVIALGNTAIDQHELLGGAMGWRAFRIDFVTHRIAAWGAPQVLEAPNHF